MSDARQHAPRGPMKARPHAVSDPMPCQKCGQVHPRGCVGHKRNGDPCGQPAMKGGWVCKMHGGKAPQVMAAAEARLDTHYPTAIRVAGELLGREEFPTVQAQIVKFVIEHKDGRATERVDANINLQVNVVEVLRQRHERAKSLTEMAPTHMLETHAGTR